MTLHLTQIFFTDARTFIAAALLRVNQLPASSYRLLPDQFTIAPLLRSPAESQGPEASGLLVAVNDSAAVQVVGAQLHRHAVAGKDADKVLAHPARDMGEHLMVVLKLDLEHGIGQRLGDRRHDFNRVFLRQSISRFCRSLLAIRPVLAFPPSRSLCDRENASLRACLLG